MLSETGGNRSDSDSTAGRQHSDQVRRLEYHDFSRLAAVRVSKRRYCGKDHKIKQQEGPDLHAPGSANLVQTLMKHELVDAFSPMILPVTLGCEKRLFAEGTIPAAFKVTESTVTSKGVVIVNYERADSQPEVYKHSTNSGKVDANSRKALFSVDRIAPGRS